MSLFIKAEWPLAEDTLEDSTLARVEVGGTYIVPQLSNGRVLILMAPQMLRKGEEFAWDVVAGPLFYGDALRKLAEISERL